MAVGNMQIFNRCAVCSCRYKTEKSFITLIVNSAYGVTVTVKCALKSDIADISAGVPRSRIVVLPGRIRGVVKVNISGELIEFTGGIVSVIHHFGKLGTI